MSNVTTAYHRTPPVGESTKLSAVTNFCEGFSRCATAYFDLACEERTGGETGGDRPAL
jgi:hypothetical protein